MQSPELVSDVHTHFLNAGATVITTNTYALVPFHIGEQTFNEQAFKLAETAAKLARDAVNAQQGEQEGNYRCGLYSPRFWLLPPRPLRREQGK